MQILGHRVIQQVTFWPLLCVVAGRAGRLCFDCQLGVQVNHTLRRFDVWELLLVINDLVGVYLVLIIDVVSVGVQSRILFVVEFGLCQEVRVQRLEELFLLRTLLVLLVRDPAGVALVYVGWRGGATLHYLVYQILSFEAAFGGLVVAYLVNALLIPVKSPHPLVPSCHVISRALALYVVGYPQLVLEVLRELSDLLLGVEATIGLGNIGVTTRPIVVIVDHFTLIRRIYILPAASLVLANIHGDAAAVLAAWRVVGAGEAAVVAGDVHVAAGTIDLVHGLKSIVAFVDRCR